MRINYKILLTSIVFLTISLGGLFAKNNTNSPYTRYGYGTVQDQTFGRSKGMGGISYGLRSGKTINPANPASYSSIDSTSFLLEFGAGGILSMFSTQEAQKTNVNGNLEYIALQMPVAKWMGLSLGILPYSFVGYNYEFNDSVRFPSPAGQDTAYNTFNQSFKGSGGVSQVYLGVSFDLWDHIALGVNGYYMFGPINHYRSITYTDASIATSSIAKQSNLYINNFNLRFGLQYHETVGTDHDFTIGAVYEFQTPLKGTLTEKTSGTDTITYTSTSAFDMPSMYGLGFTYTYANKFTLGADATYTDYSKAKFYDKTDTLNSTLQIALGSEYIHNPKGQKYIDRMMWRLGAHYSNSYINKNTHNYAISCGVGLPLRKSKTIINLNLEYGNVAFNATSPLKEQYIKLGINVSLNETWFLKSKIR